MQFSIMNLRVKDVKWYVLVWDDWLPGYPNKHNLNKHCKTC